MLQIYAHQVVKLMDSLRTLEKQCSQGAKSYDAQAMGITLGLLRDGCAELELSSATKQLDRIFGAFETCTAQHLSVSLTDLSGKLSELHTRVEEDLEDCVFFQIQPSKAKAFFKKIKRDNGTVELSPKLPEDLLGPQTIGRFPSAVMDFCEASRCFVVCRNTACVFHLMRSWR